MTTTQDTHVEGGYPALVEVHGLPDGQIKEFTYRAHAALEVGQLVLVPAPDWSVRVTGRAELPGYVLGPTSDYQGQGALRPTLPLAPDGSESNGDGLPVAEVDKTIARWRRQAQGLSAVAGHIAAAADELEKVRGQ